MGEMGGRSVTAKVGKGSLQWLVQMENAGTGSTCRVEYGKIQ